MIRLRNVLEIEFLKKCSPDGAKRNPGKDSYMLISPGSRYASPGLRFVFIDKQPVSSRNIVARVSLNSFPLILFFYSSAYDWLE